jgi:hypothetical protein
MSDFAISVDWLRQEGRSEEDATLSSMLIRVGGRDVTEFQDARGILSKKIDIPAYYLAEWIAEHWWQLLWEPRKSEDEVDNAGFLSRHSMLSAQHGFAVPRILLVPIGKSIHVSASPREVQFADVKFVRGAQATCDRNDVELQLKGFVQSVVDRLAESRVSDTWLQDTWSLISETDEEESAFCRFAGALGVSPYDIEEGLASHIERLLPTLGERLLMDLCLVSAADSFPSVAAVAEQAIELTREVGSSTLSPIASLPLPKENLTLPAYRRGIQAAVFLRQRLNIKETDVRGATRIFDLLKVDTGFQTSSARRDEEVTVTGAVVRNDEEMKIALLQKTESKRRFAGARAVFSAWSSEEKNESRLLTSAVTRDQQANRAFAAELTAPKALIRSKAKKGSLSQTAVFDLAAELQIGVDVVAKQALNNGIRVAPV